MGKIISINSFKGGCGKTTTAQTLAAGLTLRGNRCLVVDLDPQANLTLVSNVNVFEANIYELMKGSCSFDQTYQVNEYYDILPADISLSRADQEFTRSGKEFILRNILEPLREKYDYILIDTAPSLSILTINSLAACDYVIIPTEQSFYALQSLDQLCDIVKEVQGKYNKGLKVLGLLPVRYSEKASINRFLTARIDRIAKEHKIRLFETYIREGSVVCLVQGVKKNIIEIAPSSKPAKDYKRLSEIVDIECDLEIKKNII